MKYPYIATDGFNNFLVYAENTATLVGDKKNCFSSGFKITTNESGLINVTKECLANTYGKVESKGHAEFIVKLAEAADFQVSNAYRDNCGYFNFFGGNLYFWISNRDAMNSCGKLITLPLPPKEPENKEWLQVGDEVLFECSESPKSHEDCNLDEHCIVDTWFNGDKLVVVAIVTGFDGSLLPVVQNKRTKEVSTILKELIKKQKTPEEELRDELWDDVCIDSITLSQANEIFETILAKYNITKKPQ